MTARTIWEAIANASLTYIKRDALETAYQAWRKLPGNLWQDRQCFVRERPLTVAQIVRG